jgi:hypothetical protein
MQHLRQVNGNRAAIFIALSGYRDDDEVNKGPVRFDHFLEKPLNFAQLDAALKSVNT